MMLDKDLRTVITINHLEQFFICLSAQSYHNCAQKQKEDLKKTELAQQISNKVSHKKIILLIY